MGGRKSQQPGRRIDLQRGAHHDDPVGLRHPFGRLFDQRHALAEPDDERAQAVAVAVQISEFLVGGPVDDIVLIDRAAQLVQLAMQVQHGAAAGPLVQVIDVLGDDLHVVAILQPGQGEVGGIGLGRPCLSAALVVEVDDQLGVAVEGLGRGHFLHAMTFPQAVAVTKGLEAAVGADAGAGEDDDALGHGVSGRKNRTGNAHGTPLRNEVLPSLRTDIPERPTHAHPREQKRPDRRHHP